MRRIQQPMLRNPDLVQVQPWREWARRFLPAGQEGMVIEDLDLMVLRFGPLENRPYSADGKFMLLEVKHRDATLGYAQRRVFGLLHRLLRRADKERRLYQGFFIVHRREDPPLGPCPHCSGTGQMAPALLTMPEDELSRIRSVNGYVVQGNEFRDFLLGKMDIPSLFDQGES